MTPNPRAESRSGKVEIRSPERCAWILDLKVNRDVPYSRRFRDSGSRHSAALFDLRRGLIEFIDSQVLHQIPAAHGESLVPGPDDDELSDSFANREFGSFLPVPRSNDDHGSDRCHPSEESVDDDSRKNFALRNGTPHRTAHGTRQLIRENGRLDAPDMQGPDRRRVFRCPARLGSGSIPSLGHEYSVASVHGNRNCCVGENLRLTIHPVSGPFCLLPFGEGAERRGRRSGRHAGARPQLMSTKVGWQL